MTACGSPGREGSRPRRPSTRSHLLPLWLFALLCLAACARSEAPSALEPGGFAADQIARLWWVMLGLGTLIWLGVMGYLAWALFRRRPRHVEPGPDRSPEPAPTGGPAAWIGGGIALATVLFSYFYIRLENMAWPPAGVAPPGLLPAGLSAALLLVSAGGPYWALRSIRGDRQGGLRLCLALAFLLALAALGLQVFDFNRLGFDWQFHAYGSLFYLLGGTAVAIVLVGLGINLFIQFWAWRAQYSAGHHLAVENGPQLALHDTGERSIPPGITWRWRTGRRSGTPCSPDG